MPSALVSGPTAGIGLAFARALADRGYDLVLVARDAARLQSLADELSSSKGIAVEVLPADLAEPTELRRVEERLGRPEAPVDLLVNNAGFGLPERFPYAPIEDEERMLDVLVRAVLRLSHAAIRPMLERGSGAIVNVSSVAGFMPYGTYGAAKAWVTSFSQGLDASYRKRGCRVLALCPGFVRTEFHSRGDINTAAVMGWMWLDAEEVVAQALADLDAGRSVSVPGRRYRALMAVVRLAPRRAVATAANRWR